MKALTFLFLWTTSLTLFAEQTINFIETYRPERGAFKMLRVPMSFDNDSITRPAPRGLDIDMVYRVDYVASSTTKNISSYQKNLNQSRWNKLRDFLNIEESEVFDTRIYYQVTEHAEDAKQLFHGFVVYYQGSAEGLHVESMSAYPSLINKIAGFKVTPNTDRLVVPKSVQVDSVYLGDIHMKEKKALDVQLVRNNHIIEWGYDSIGRDKKYYNSFYILTKVSAGIFAAFTSLTDRTLFDMLRRNKVNANTLIVTDLTGSMYPYYAQLLVWHAVKMSKGERANHVFFNDGDRKLDCDKVIGNTGGIYTTSSNDVLKVYRKMDVCMKSGFGGDCPENNFEAVKFGLKKFTNTDNVILICDNWAVPRDTSLLSTIDQPIAFVMCGTTLGLNPSYLNLCKQNCGSITTIERSLSHFDMTKPKDGSR